MFIRQKSNTERRQRSYLFSGATAFSLALFAAPSGVLAQSGADGVLEEIVVTSRRYEESIEDAPVAVAVMSQDFIQNNRIDKADDIFNYTPGATWESFSKMQPVASMRGVIAPTPGNASSESSIQTVMDNVVISKDFMKSPPLYDLARVEVMRGPQGTSFGRNASVGLIHIVTNRPTQETSGSVQGTVGTDERFELKGHFEQPDRSDEPSWTHPVIADGRLYLRDQGLLLCYDVRAAQ